MYNVDDARTETASSLILFLAGNLISGMSGENDPPFTARLSITGGAQSLKDNIQSFELTIEGENFSPMWQTYLQDMMAQLVYDLALHQRWLIRVEYKFL